MQNLDFFPENSVIFRYDLKFSEVNRKHVDALSDIQIINDLLISNDENYREVLNLSIARDNPKLSVRAASMIEGSILKRDFREVGEDEGYQMVDSDAPVNSHPNDMKPYS